MGHRERAAELAERVAALARERGLTVGVAESLTGGLLASTLARADGASAWFPGGIVAYGRDVKHRLLGVRPGPVVAESAAVEMAEAAARALAADVVVAVTGVGGPEPQDGEPPGTVWVATHGAGHSCPRCHRLPGEPSEVCEEAVVAALEHLLAVLTEP